MATKDQSSYISDLAVAKTKEFKEVKELLISSGIISDNAQIINDAQSIAEITNALDDIQASKLIDVLNATKEPARARVYSQKRVVATVGILDDIKSTINDWGF